MDGCARCFGQVEVDGDCRRLLVAGRLVKLDRSCAAILSVLISEAGKDVAKDRLLEAGWPGRVVHENSLAKAIGRLRQALGDDGEALETIHGCGYRLAAEPQAAVLPEPGKLPARLRLPRRAAAAAALGLAAVAAVSLAAITGDTRKAHDKVLVRGEPADAVGRVLWIDDHPENNVDEKRFLERRKIAVYQVASSDEALALLAMYDYGAVISDMNRDDQPLAGLELVREMRRRDDQTPFFLYTIVPTAAQYKLLTDAGGQGATVTPAELYSAIVPLFGASGSRQQQPS